MNTSPEDLRRVLLRRAFQMPSVQTMMSRKSSITNAYASAVMPVIVPTIEEIEEALAILAIDPADMRCAYCGGPSTEWDHLRPVVLRRRPTGFISEIANLVPSCGKCNQSKGNKPWRDWMLSKAPLSPTGRAVPGVSDRIARIETFERWRPPTQIDFAGIVGETEWEEYWRLCEAVVTELQRSQEVANDIRQRVSEATKKS